VIQKGKKKLFFFSKDEKKTRKRGGKMWKIVVSLFKNKKKPPSGRAFTIRILVPSDRKIRDVTLVLTRWNCQIWQHPENWNHVLTINYADIIWCLLGNQRFPSCLESEWQGDIKDDIKKQMQNDSCLLLQSNKLTLPIIFDSNDARFQFMASLPLGVTCTSETH
jgi:hypothetical protein